MNRNEKTILWVAIFWPLLVHVGFDKFNNWTNKQVKVLQDGKISGTSGTLHTPAKQPPDTFPPNPPQIHQTPTTQPDCSQTIPEKYWLEQSRTGKWGVATKGMAGIMYLSVYRDNSYLWLYEGNHFVAVKDSCTAKMHFFQSVVEKQKKQFHYQ